MGIMAPLCFVLMPFGKKPISGGHSIDFDQVYSAMIKPAVKAAGLKPLRADEEMAGGIIHKAMFERLILCEYAVADLTTANANVFYELGVRHSVRPHATQLLYADGWGQLPFDVDMLRALPYKLTPGGIPADPTGDSATLKARLEAAREAVTDSPLFQLVEDFPDIKRLKTDVFRDQVKYAEEIKNKLKLAIKNGVDAVAEVERELGDISLADAACVTDLFLSYRSVKAWEHMIRLVDKMAPPLASTILVREQLGLALNRAGHGEDAECVLLDLINRKGPSSETYGILGRVYKDRWEKATEAGDTFLLQGMLDKAIEAYLTGFQTDWRDAYPGINALTLMEVKPQPDSRGRDLLPVVAYAVKRRIDNGQPDYWDYATLLELSVLERNQEAAEEALTAALAHIREIWEPETTARNLRLIREARKARGEVLQWAEECENSLGRMAK